MDTPPLRKYPRTQHLVGSALQAGDEDLSQVPFSEISGRHVVIEEKCDGANCAISFAKDGRLLLQSRGHYLTGGYRERHYALLKTWATTRMASLYEVLKDRYIMYGEWMAAKHTVFYDALPHYFLEFDVYDRRRDIFLDTPSRQRLLEGAAISSVPVLGEGEYSSLDEVLSHLGPSRYITQGSEAALVEAARKAGVEVAECLSRTDMGGLMEGLYLKVEEEGQVKMRVKYVRAHFLQCIDFDEKNWLDKPIVANGLRGTLEDLYA